MYRFTLILLAALIATGCSYNRQPERPESQLSGDNCMAALQEMQQLSLSYTGFQQGEQVDGAPWLRSNRLVDYFIRQNELSEPQLADLLNYMSLQAINGLTLEFQLLPAAQQQQWQRQYKVTDPGHFIDRCSRQLVQQQTAMPQQSRRFLQQLSTDDDYQSLARVLGLYPLTALLFKQGVIQEHHWLSRQPELLKHSSWTTYGPQITGTKTPDLRNIARNSLGIPILNPRLQQALIEHHAPLWQLPDTLPVNLPGQPYWHANTLKVDQQPVSFSYISHGIHQNQTTLQLNYLIWFPERSPESHFDLVAGQHDAVLFRVHLTHSGKLIAYDSVHLCGCWYSLILPRTEHYQATSMLYREPTFVLRTEPGRQLISLTSNSHLLIASQKADTALSLQHRYQLRPFSDLLQLNSGPVRRSAFNRQGFVAGSERPERWFFWPMGIRNPGALRRPGDHAIRFVGKLHFDDPLILEKLGVGKDAD